VLNRLRPSILAVSLLAAWPSVSLSQPVLPPLPPPTRPGLEITRQDGFEFVTVGSPGNAPFAGPSPLTGYPIGRGRVDYAFRISRLEVTSAQWVDFMNVLGQDIALSVRSEPASWGAQEDLNDPRPGRQYALFDSTYALMPVTGITWHTAAMFCNWLHNGRTDNFASLMSGAYDTSTWGSAPGGGYTDQSTHSPGARYWIPTLDEWLKAVHYDPDRNGPGQGGYWRFANSSDTPPVFGPPGVGTSNAGINNTPFSDRLGQYPNSQTPWGLLDADGMASEWTEEWLNPLRPVDRVVEGGGTSSAGIGVNGTPTFLWSDIEFARFAPPTSFNSDAGLRIASIIPAPGMFPMACLSIISLSERRRRQS
jgi:formylglycine-generating enzyme required for sulfatase activity